MVAVIAGKYEHCSQRQCLAWHRNTVERQFGFSNSISWQEQINDLHVHRVITIINEHLKYIKNI